MAKSLPADEAMRFKRVRYEDLPQPLAFYLLDRLAVQQQCPEHGQARVLDWLKVSGWEVCGAEWSDGLVGPIIWQGGSSPGKYDVFAGYHEAAMLREDAEGSDFEAFIGKALGPRRSDDGGR